MATCKSAKSVYEAIRVYSKAVPETTWEQLERAFRTNQFNTYLIAQEKEEITPTYTLIDLQGYVLQLNAYPSADIITS